MQTTYSLKTAVSDSGSRLSSVGVGLHHGQEDHPVSRRARKSGDHVHALRLHPAETHHGVQGRVGEGLELQQRAAARQPEPCQQPGGLKNRFQNLSTFIELLENFHFQSGRFRTLSLIVYDSLSDFHLIINCLLKRFQAY